MRLCLYCGHVFLVFIFTNAEKVTKNADTEEEETPQKDSVFADVIRNITRVNNVLQDLIQNYEKLQKIYKSQETLEDYTDKADGSREGIERFRGSRHKAKTLKDHTSTQSTTINMNFPATQIFASASAESSEKRKAKMREKNKQPKKTVEKTKEKDKTTTDNEIVSGTSSEEESKESNESSSAKEQNEKLRGKQSLREPKQPNETKNVKEIEPESHTKTIEVITTVTELPKQGIKNQTLKKQIIQTETFSDKNIWDDIMNNKPVVLKKEKEIIYSKRKNDDPYGRHKKKVAVTKKEETNKTTINNTTLMKNQTENKNSNSKLIYRTQDSQNATLTSQSAEDERTIKKEQFKTLILRKAYGDACLKVVVKKCYKACKGTLKRGCRLYSCKDDFSKMFKANSKTGCIKEFRELEVEAKVSDTGANGQKFKVTDEFLDLTRNGYLAAACLPKSGPRELPLLNKGNKANRRNAKETEPSSIDHELNILRDRFERACQKSSSEKCVKACSFAVDETCATHDCSGNKKEEMKKACKKECKSAYSYSSTSSKKSKSSESSGSGSGSESGSSGSSSESEEKHTTKRKVKIVTPSTSTTPKRFIKISKNTRARPIVTTTKKVVESVETKPALRQHGDEKSKKQDDNIKSKPKRTTAFKVDKKVDLKEKSKVQKKVKAEEKEKETKEKETEEKSATEESEEEEE